MKALISCCLIVLFGCSLAFAEEVYEIEKLPRNTVEKLFILSKECEEIPDNVCGLCVTSELSIVSTTEKEAIRPGTHLYEVIFSLNGKKYRVLCGVRGN